MVKTGIPKLDEGIGELQQGNSIMFYSEPGVENLEFAQQIGFNFLKNNQKCVYFVNNKKPETVQEMFLHYGWSISDYIKNKKFIFIDAYSSLIGAGSNDNATVQNPSDISVIDRIITASIKKYPGSAMIFDTLTNMLDMFEFELLDDYLKKWTKLARENKVNLIFLFTEWAYEKDILDSLKSFCDIVVELKAIERNVILRKYFSILKLDDQKISHKDIPFKILSPGGVKIYVPKILVTGPYHAGKTSFIHSASQRPVSVNRMGTTIALDFGHAEVNGFSVDLFGTPGQERFDPILKQLGGESLGVILVVDSTKPEDFTRAKEMLDLTKTTGLPTVIAANKADMKGALSVEQIRSRMNLPKEYPILPVSAENYKEAKPGEPCRLKKDDIANVLKKLLEKVV